jgi:hypothetical protein
MGQSSANGFYDSSVNFEFPTPLEKAQVVASSSCNLVTGIFQFDGILHLAI